MQHADAHDHQDIRDAVARLCAEYPGDYWRGLDAKMAYPTEFVQALTQAGFLSALIPETFGGSGLGLSAAAAILEEIQRAGCNGAACHAQMYVMGTVLRHGSDGAEGSAICRRSPRGALRMQAFGVTEPTSGSDTSLDQDLRAPRRRPLYRQRPEDLDQPRRAFRPDAAAGAHHAATTRSPSAPTGSRSSSSTCARRWATA